MVGTEAGLHQLDGQPMPIASGRPVTHLIARENDEIWAVLEGRTIARGVPTALEPMADVDGLRARCLAVAEGGVLVGTSEAHLLRLQPSLRAVEGFDRVEGRDGWYTPWGGPPDTRSISVGADGTVYVNVHVGGIPTSRDGGETWSPTIAVDADVHQVLAHPTNPGLVFAATAYGLARSEDGANSWVFETDGLHAEYCRAVAVAGDTLLLSASESHIGRRAALYRKPVEEARPWERCTMGLPQWFADNIDTHTLIASGQIAAFGTTDGRVFVSNDAGWRWEEAARGLPPIRCVALTER